MKRPVLILAMLSYFLFAFSQNYSYNLIYQKLELWVNPAVRYIKGAVTIGIDLPKPEQQITVDLSSDLIVDSIKMKEQKLGFSADSDRINIDLGQALQGKNFFTVFYHGVPPENGFGTFTTSTHYYGIKPIMWTLSEPYGAKDWFPTKNNLGDKIDSIDIIVHTKPEYRVASNGVLVLDTVTGKERTVHWKSRYPIASYLVAIAVTNYDVFVDTARIGDSIVLPVMNFVYPEDLREAKSKLPYATKCLEFFSKKFIPYPFYKEKYGQAEFGWGGGMEHQTMTFVSDFSQPMLSHELAHQWFGDYITCGSWSEIYLNEAFATYLEGLTAEAGIADYSFSQWLTLARVYAFADTRNSIYVKDTSKVNRIFYYNLTYMKSALFLHMLRWMMGDSAFFAGLRNYLTDSNLVYGFAHTPDLEWNLEKACGCDLSFMFQQWVYGTGYPFYDIKVVQLDSNNYFVKVNQKPRSKNVKFFRLKLPLVFQGVDGSDSVVVLDNIENGQQFGVSLPFRVKGVEFDPDMWILAKAKISYITTSDSLLDTGKVVIFPGFTSSKLTYWVSKKLGSGKVEIVSLGGKVICESVLPDVDYNFTGSIDVSALDKGVYFFVVKQNGKVFKTLKFTKL